LKKIAASKKKKEKEAKKLPNKKSAKQKLIQIPNICPFKEEILKDVEADKQRREEEKRLHLEKLKQDREALKNKPKNLESMVVDANERADNHEEKEETSEDHNIRSNKENSLKSFFKEFKKVVDAADVILEIVDARDPLGTRCKEVLEIIRDTPGQKKHVLLLNKSDLIPRDNLDKWLKYFRKFGPVLPFKASTQSQKLNIGRKRFHKNKPVIQCKSYLFGSNLG
jgi:nuclear GTP-binding protein